MNFYLYQTFYIFMFYSVIWEMQIVFSGALIILILVHALELVSKELNPLAAILHV